MPAAAVTSRHVAHRSWPGLVVLLLAVAAVDGNITYYAGPSDNLTAVLGTLSDAPATVLLRPGTYLGAAACSWRFRRGQTVSILSIAGYQQTVIDCEGGSGHVRADGARIIIQGIHFTGGRQEDGGSIGIDDSDFSLLDSKVSNSTGNAGGAICVRGGSLRVDRCSFSANSARGPGGCIWANNARVQVNGSTFTGCRAGTFGGSIGIFNASTLRLAESDILHSHAVERGGGLFAGGACNCTVAGGVIMQATSLRGGGAFVDDRSALQMARTHVRLNAAEKYGGGVYLYDRSLGIFTTGVVIDDNVAFDGGGGVILYMNSAMQAHGGVSFSNNSCAGQEEGGGGIYGGQWSRIELVGGDLDLCQTLLGWPPTLLSAAAFLVDTPVPVPPSSPCRPAPSGKVTVLGNVAVNAGAGIFLEGQSLLVARGEVVIASNSQARVGGGLAVLPASTGWLADGVLLAHNSAQQGGGAFVYGVGAWLQVVGARVSGNVAQVGGALMAGPYRMPYSDSDRHTIEFKHVTFRDNEASANGGAVATDSFTHAVFDNCSFVTNAAGTSGGAVYAAGRFTHVAVQASHFSSNLARAAHGGCMSVVDFARLALERSTLSRCRAFENGGGVSTLQGAELSVRDVTIDECSASSMGGALYHAGAACQILTSGSSSPAWPPGTSLTVRRCSAQKGGGVGFVSPLEATAGRLHIASCSAVTDGGGLYGLGGSARVYVGSHGLVIEDCKAGRDGGGIALHFASQIVTQVPGCDSSTCRGNGRCDLQCLNPMCSWDDGECSSLFTDAGQDAKQPCSRDPGHGCPIYIERAATGVCAPGCMRASCDWASLTSTCDGVKRQLASCPVFDIAARHSLLSQPSLVYLREGVGFTHASPLWPGGSGSRQGIGRCDGLGCQTSAPPATAEGGELGALSANEPWCYAVNDHGRVLQQPGQAMACPCADLGPAWGACAQGQQPRLPSLGMNYSAAALQADQRTSILELLRNHKGCGDLPITFTRNRAGRYGGGIFKEGCANELDNNVCWIGNVPVDSHSSLMILFDSNEAGVAGGGVFTSCQSSAACKRLHQKTLGLPTIDGKESGRVLQFTGTQRAGGYGAEMATVAAMIGKVTYPRLPLVPGQSMINVSLSLFDGFSQHVQGLPTLPVSHVVKAIVTPAHVSCSTVADCTRHELQPTVLLRTDGTRRLTSTSLLLQFCQISETHMNLHLFLSTTDSGESVSQRVIPIVCAPQCEQGQKREEKTWPVPSFTCRSCQRNEYILNSSNASYQCNRCPLGLECRQDVWSKRVVDSVWREQDYRLRLTQCPSGFLVERDDTNPEGDRCRECEPGKFSLGISSYDQGLSRQQCIACIGNYPEEQAECKGHRGVTARENFWQGKARLCLVKRGGEVDKSDCRYPAEPEHRLYNQSGVHHGKSFAAPALNGQNSNYVPVAFIYPCHPAQACVLYNESRPPEEASCAESHTGVACAVCKNGTQMSGGLCAKCRRDGSLPAQFWVIIVFGSPVLVFMYYWFLCRKLWRVHWVEKHLTAITASGLGFTESNRWMISTPATMTPKSSRGTMKNSFNTSMQLRIHQAWTDLLDKPQKAFQFSMSFKIVASFIQVLGTFRRNFGAANWQGSHLSIMELLAPILNVEVSDLPGLFCKFGERGFLSKIQFVTIAPVIIIFFMSIPFLYCCAMGLLSPQRSVRAHPHYSQSLTCFLSSLMIFLFLIYPWVSSTLLRCFLCLDYGPDDGKRLFDDRRVVCTAFHAEPLASSDGDNLTAHVYIVIWAAICCLVYIIGVPLAVMLGMWHGGVPQMAAQKIADARFLGLLNLRRKQIGTMTGAICANAIGRIDDDEEFKKRANFLYGRLQQSALADSSCGELQTPPNLSAEGLRRGIAGLANIRTDAIPIGDVQELLRSFDTDQDGLSEDEFLVMLRHLTSDSILFTGYESLDRLSKRQITALRYHDWSLNNKSLSVRERDPDRIYEGLAKATPVSRLNTLKKRASLKISVTLANMAETHTDEEAESCEEMISWLQNKAIQLDKSGKLRRPASEWSSAAGPQEELAIKRFGFVFMAYRVHFWYFDFLWIFYKLFITSLIILWIESPPTQLVMAFCVTFAFLMVYLSAMPLATKMLNRLMSASLAVTCLNILCGFWEIRDSVFGRSFAVFVAILNFLVVFYPILHLIMDVRAVRRALQDARKSLDNPAAVRGKFIGDDTARDSGLAAQLQRFIITPLASLRSRAPNLRRETPKGGAGSFVSPAASVVAGGGEGGVDGDGSADGGDGGDRSSGGGGTKNNTSMVNGAQGRRCFDGCSAGLDDQAGDFEDESSASARVRRAGGAGNFFGEEEEKEDSPAAPSNITDRNVGRGAGSFFGDEEATDADGADDDFMPTDTQGALRGDVGQLRQDAGGRAAAELARATRLEVGKDVKIAHRLFLRPEGGIKLAALPSRAVSRPSISPLLPPPSLAADSPPPANSVYLVRAAAAEGDGGSRLEGTGAHGPRAHGPGITKLKPLPSRAVSWVSGASENDQNKQQSERRGFTLLPLPGQIS